MGSDCLLSTVQIPTDFSTFSPWWDGRLHSFSFCTFNDLLGLGYLVSGAMRNNEILVSLNGGFIFQHTVLGYTDTEQSRTDGAEATETPSRNGFIWPSSSLCLFSYLVLFIAPRLIPPPCAKQRIKAPPIKTIPVIVISGFLILIIRLPSLET
jgi:hypothetical protein